jgi:hypothetical protein
MKTSQIIVITLLGLLSAGFAPAGDFDGSKPFRCSPIRIVVCPRIGEVEKDSAADVNLPEFFQIDVGKKLMSGKGSAGEERKSPIETVRHEHGTLILEGVQLGKAWHAVIDEQTGQTTITGTTADTAFVIFASCTLSPAQVSSRAGESK